MRRSRPHFAAPFAKQNGAIIRESISGEIDPAGQEKDALEREIESAMIAYWRGQQQRIQAELEPQIPDDRKAIIQLAMPFWKQEAQHLLSILLPFIQRGAEGGVGVHQGIVEPLGIGIDWTLPFTEAANWARQYAGELVRGVTDTTKERIRTVVGGWVEQEGRTFPDLWKAIMEDPAFDMRRAKLIASTEATRAYAEGEMVAAGEMERAGYFEYEKVWQTSNDDRVCPICAPLQGETVQGVRGMFDSLAGELEAPPAHPGCRCWINTVPSVPE